MPNSVGSRKVSSSIGSVDVAVVSMVCSRRKRANVAGALNERENVRGEVTCNDT